MGPSREMGVDVVSKKTSHQETKQKRQTSCERNQKVGRSELTLKKKKKKTSQGFFSVARKKGIAVVRIGDTLVFGLTVDWCVPAPSGSRRSFLVW
jgi:hypothetical protein